MGKIRKILIADDDRVLASALSEFFTGFDDYEVCGIANNGQKALDMIEQEIPDLVILDLVMPNLDGLGVLEKVKNLELETSPKIVFITSFAQSNLTKRAMELGADYYMMKPFDMDTLATRIRQICEINSGTDTVDNTSNLELDITRILSSNGCSGPCQGLSISA